MYYVPEFSLSFVKAFFQVNSKGAEALYKTVGDLAGLEAQSTLVDVCCGTGTIGLCLADRVKQVRNSMVKEIDISLFPFPSPYFPSLFLFSLPFSFPLSPLCWLK